MNKEAAMKIRIVVLTLCVFVLFGADLKAQPKEVTESVTTTYYVTPKVVPLGETSAVMSYDGVGLTISDTGQGLFHQATVRVIGSLTIDKGKWNDERASTVWNLLNGDKVFATVTGTGERGKPGEVNTTGGTVTITGGTGKCSGIQGTFTFARYNLPKAAIEGITQSYVKANIKYTLPQ
jgi:hypothetical protein